MRADPFMMRASVPAMVLRSLAVMRRSFVVLRRFCPVALRQVVRGLQMVMGCGLVMSGSVHVVPVRRVRVVVGHQDPSLASTAVVLHGFAADRE